MKDLTRLALLGAATGAAGTTALNAVTYLDMAVRGRPSNSTPEDTVEALSSKTHVPVPGEGGTRQNRLQGLGKRLRSSVGYVPPIEFETEHYRSITVPQPLPGELTVH